MCQQNLSSHSSNKFIQNQTRQVCVQTHSSALNVTFAAERWRLQHGICSAPAEIDRYLLPAGGHSAANLPAAAVNQWDREMDASLLHSIVSRRRQ